MVYRSWGKKSFSDSDMFSWVELDPKFGILAFSAIFVLFFWVAKNLIYIDNAFNGYSYLKSTRKGLSDGTLMLKKEYRLARWNCDWKSYTFPKKYPPARENDQKFNKKYKMAENHLDTLGTILDPRKVIFSHFLLFLEFWSFSQAGGYFLGNVHDFQSHFHLSKCYSFFNIRVPSESSLRVDFK